MTCRDTLQCVHEPFGDAFYFGPERLSERYEQDEAARAESGFEDSTYRTIFERIDRENTEVGSLPPRLARSRILGIVSVPFVFAIIHSHVQKSREKKRNILLSCHLTFPSWQLCLKVPQRYSDTLLFAAAAGESAAQPARKKTPR